MPYSTRYIMDQMARGRPTPVGSPEPILHRAIGMLSPPDIESAVRMGARMDSPDNRGRSSFHILVDAALKKDNTPADHPQRILACVQALVRNRANPLLVDRTTKLTALARLAPLAQTSIGPQLLQLLRPLGRWTTPEGPERLSVADRWAEYGDDRMKKSLGVAVTPPAPVPPRSPPRP